MKRFAIHHVPNGKNPAQSSLPARLSLGFADDGGITRMLERSHFGPLRVQKPLYPEGGHVCHAIIVHPPGGAVGGDELEIRARVGEGASAFITTPGAAKWYKANGRISRQSVHLDVEADATLEWLPQETIFYDTAQVRLDNTIVLGTDATYIGCEILCFGRTASGESFASGRIEQRTSIRRDSKLLWFEQGALSAGRAAMSSPFGLAGKTVHATLIGVGKVLPASSLGTIREAGAAMENLGDAFGVTQMKAVVVARYLGDSSETAKRLMMEVWRQLRPALLQRDGVVPRIWHT